MSGHTFRQPSGRWWYGGRTWGRVRTFSVLHLCTDATQRHAAQVNRTATPWIIGALKHEPTPTLSQLEP